MINSPDDLRKPLNKHKPPLDVQILVSGCYMSWKQLNDDKRFCHFERCSVSEKQGWGVDFCTAEKFEDFPSCPFSLQADSHAICKHLQAYHRSIFGGVVLIEACFPVTADASRPSDAESAFGSPLSLQNFSIQLQVPYWRHALRRSICRRWHTLADTPLPTLSR